ncbi:MAG: FMN-binding glutamate synthase family protein [Acidimicrobiales bacterium]
MSWGLWVLLGLGGFLVALALYDITQKRHAVLRNFPVVGHLRFLLESFGPELRQYIVSDNEEERPFSRDQRRWVYATAKRENPYFGFGTDNHIEQPGYILFRHAAFPAGDGGHDDGLPAAKVLGEWHGRPAAFRPDSMVNVSAMSFGSLSGPAVEALTRGAAIAGCLHNTGEGGISVHHRHGGELVYQVGTGYFGCRGPEGRFSMDALLATVADTPVRAIEVKLSQGAKPGLGGVLPAAKVTPAIAEARGVPVGITVRSPNRHREFDDVAGLVDFVERLADATGLPVGVKSAVGERSFWSELAEHMARTGRGPDFVTIDGGEGGTGAAPLVFSDHVALPFRIGFAQVYGAFAEAGLHHDMVFVASGKLGFPTDAMVAIAMGADMVNVAREAMMAIGCIQAQRCHNGHCPTGVATQGRWLTRGLDPTDKSARLANYVCGLRAELLQLAHALGAEHPCLVDPSAIEVRTGHDTIMPLLDSFGYDPTWRTITSELRATRLAVAGG